MKRSDPSFDGDDVCYGTICNVKSSFLPGRKVADSIISCVRAANSTYVHFKIEKRRNFFAILDEESTDKAFLDTKTTKSLNAVEEMQDRQIRYEAIIKASVFSKRSRSIKQQRSSIFPISVNLYGPSSKAGQLGNQLAGVPTWLQHPYSLPPKMSYNNPHFFVPPGVSIDMTKFIGEESPIHRKRKITDKTISFLDSLDGTTDEDEITLSLPPNLKTSLKRHQKIGLHFILAREQEAFMKKQQNTILGDSSDGLEPSKNGYIGLGGLIADVMGLGKTLTMLTAISCTIPQAEFWADFMDDMVPRQSNAKERTKASLVIVPSSQLIDVWMTEIAIHFSANSIRLLSFHGTKRPRSLRVVKEYDVVLTTYATLIAERKASGPIFDLMWYRVVLDEAHWIRNSSTNQYTAITSIHSRSRWCVTGTPIQNSLEDLASLSGFLRLSPFQTKRDFQNDVILPLIKDEAQVSLLLRSQFEVRLMLSQYEQDLYQAVLDRKKRKMDEMVSNNGVQRYGILFAAILELRRLCTLGSFLHSKGKNRGNSVDANQSDCSLCSPDDKDNHQLLLMESFCPDCARELRVTQAGSTLSCPPGQEFNPSPSPGRESTEGNDSSLGKSTKLEAVMDRVRGLKAGTKCIVFSYWTKTLDLLATMLEATNKIRYLQIDGRVKYSERLERLDCFRNDSDISVLLMTIETGSVGLNLTVANQVHIVEPQWNPSVEDQAIARVLRMGQTQEVSIFRYVMQDTVEESINSLKRMKKSLAVSTFDAGPEDEFNAKLADLRFVLSERLTSKKPKN